MGDVRAGVVGAGVFGGYHAQKYAGDPRADLAGVFDPDMDRAGALANTLGVEAFASLDALLEAVDVVTVATPAPYHGAVGLAALKAGKHVLVEKPIAIDLADARAMVAAADAGGLTLQVGHQERFVFAAMGLLDVPEMPTAVAARRLNPFHQRGADVSVTLDLMTHDLDLVRLLAGRAEVLEVRATCAREKTDTADRTDAELTFANGMTASLKASRLNAAPDRGMAVLYESGTVEVDFVAKTFTNTTAHALNADFAHDPSARDSLGAGVKAFLDAVIDASAPAVSGVDGLAALQLALAVDAAGTHQAP